MCGILPLAAAALRAHGTLFGERLVVTDRRGDMGGLCVDLGSSPPLDNNDIYNNSLSHSHHY